MDGKSRSQFDAFCTGACGKKGEIGPDESESFCDFSHTLSAAGGNVCPQMPDFTLDSTVPKARDFGSLDAKCVQKYGLDVNDVQKFE